jgi:phenylpropionate dioxygenase-like ring-hydroxylating dioxygenase large terminal subunit
VRGSVILRAKVMTPEDNELLTRVGLGTPMGELLRRYWLPLVESEELGPPDGPPRRVRLLGENLVAFRDSGGQVGLLDQRCPHRGASLFFGRNEEGGLRCVYHGWKFDSEGRCLETPTEPSETFARGVRARAYRCVERNGVVWAYLGPAAAEAPPLPDLGWAVAAPENRSTLTYLRACNWLQALEGDVDTAHLGWLHARMDETGRRRLPARADDPHRDKVAQDLSPVLSVVDHSAGVTIAARRNDDDGRHYWRISQFLMPIFTSVPATGRLRRAKAWVPLDDEHTLVWERNWDPSEALSVEQRRGRAGRVPGSGMHDDGDEPLSRGRFVASRDNDYRIDRERQRTASFSGLEESAPVQDAAVQESMGPIVDRSREHLGASDEAIIRVRRRLLEAARALRDGGVEPPGIRSPESYRLRGCQLVLPPGADWQEASREEQRA